MAPLSTVLADAWYAHPLALGAGGLVALALAIALAIRFRPGLVTRWILWLPAHLLYRIRVSGKENIPTTGGALLVCNHVSFIDAFLVFLSQKRQIRFLIWAPYARIPVLGYLLRLAKVIPIDASEGPRAILKSLRTASDALNQGELVCIFAEGGISRTGFLLPFNRGFEQIAKHADAPIIPVCLEHVWGSIFSYQGGKFFWKWPQVLPYPVQIAFGKPLPAHAKAFDVRLAIKKLSADCAIERAGERHPVHRQFVRMACKHPFRLCLIDPINHDRKFKYAEALTASWCLANLLREKLAADPMVALWLPPSAGGVFANVALALLGKPSVNLNYTSSAESIRSGIEQCGVKHILTSRAFLSKMKLEPPSGVELIFLEELVKQVTKPRKIWAMARILLFPAWVTQRILGVHRHQADDLATIIFSSGSTGEPKGVMLTHRNLSANVESTIQAIDPRPSDCLLGILPFFHSFGYTVTIWVPLQVGASEIFLADPRAAKEIGETCKKHQCTIFLSTPTLLRFCLRRCEPDEFKSLRILVTGAEKLPMPLADEFQAKFGIRPMEGYGCTELSPVAAVNVPDWESAGVKQTGNRPGTIGQPVPGVAAKVVDLESGEPLGPNKEGMLYIYGGNVMKGYLNKPEATASVIQDGWYITGDIAKYDDDGFVIITDRLARFSKIGGEMVPHQKVEDELHHILDTTDRVCTVTSLPDEKKGERLVVMHIPLPKLTPRELCQQLSQRGLPNLWIPGERDFMQIAEMPVLGSGKVDLKRVKDLARERAGK